jgi:hypothetical protein
MKTFAQNRTTIDFTAVFRSIEIVAICFDTASVEIGRYAYRFVKKPSPRVIRRA